MLVHKPKKALIFKLRDPTRITTVIPTAKTIKHNGNQLVAVPHRPDEVRVLRSLGFEPPNPLPLYYGFPGKFTPFEAQRITADFAVMHSRCYILNSMGLGKTVTTLWGYDYLRSVKQVNKVLIVCPLSTMERTWADEIFQSFPQYDAVVLHGTRARRLKLLEQDADIYIINTDGVDIIKDALKLRPDINLIVVDELAMVRNASTKRWKALNEVINKQSLRRAWGLTGSPTPNLPTDAWAQCRLITPANESVPKYFGQFRDRVMRQVTQFKWVPREGAAEIVHEMMQPAIRFTLDDCVDLPEQTYVTRTVALTAEQRQSYLQMLSKLQTEYEGGQILAVNEAVKANKLIQIALGVAYSADGGEVILPSAPRLEVLNEVVEESEGKVLVFVPLSGALHSVAQHLRDQGHSVEVIEGSTPKNDRDRIFHAFQKLDEPRVIVANPTTMSHGLTLTAATTIVWYGPVHSNEVYEQACARVRRPGQTRTTVIVHIVSTEIERRIYERLKTKQTLQGSLLDLMKEGAPA